MTIAGKPQAGDRIGYGPIYPLRFVGGDFEAGSGFALVRSAALIILGADAATQDGKVHGEFPANPRLGTSIRRYIHRNIRGLFSTIIRVAGVEGLTRFEPRLEINPSRSDVTTDNRRRVKIQLRARVNPEYSGTGVSDSGGIEATY